VLIEKNPSRLPKKKEMDFFPPTTPLFSTALELREGGNREGRRVRGGGIITRSLPSRERGSKEGEPTQCSCSSSSSSIRRCDSAPGGVIISKSINAPLLSGRACAGVFRKKIARSGRYLMEHVALITRPAVS